jgi:hypothetical protein
MEGYNYMKFICDRFLRLHKELDFLIIDTLYKIIPEIELLCDQMEEFMINKYFKAKSLSKKIYFKQEDIL